MSRVVVSDHYDLTIAAKIGDDPEQPPVARGASRRVPKVPAADAEEKRRAMHKAQHAARRITRKHRK